MHLRTKILWGKVSECLPKLGLAGRGLFCTRRNPHFIPQGLDLYHLKISPEPKVEEVYEYWEKIRDLEFDFVLAVGGGSVLDVAKILGAMKTNRMKVEEMIGIEKLREDPLPITAVPTTHGSGSEVTRYAVVKLPGRKRTVVSERICPKYAVIDPGLAMGLPKETTLYTSLDALCHNLEAFLTIYSDPIVDRICEQGVRCFLEGIDLAVEDELKGRELMMLCSLFGGIAITNAQTSIVHALSHILGGRVEIPHGLANAVFLTAYLEFHRDTEKMRELQRRLGIDLVEYLRDLYEKYDIPRLGDFIGENEISEIAELAAADQRLTSADVRGLNRVDILKIVQRSY